MSNLPSSESTTYDKAQVQSLLSSASKPETSPETITVWYGGWSLNELRKMCPDLFYDQSWYAKEAFADEKHEAGMYTVCLRMPGSSNKTFEEQKALLTTGEEVTPAAIAATAFLAHWRATGVDALDDEWTRCKEQAADGYRVALYWHEGRLNVLSYWDDDRYDGVWSSSVRRLPDA